MRIPAVVLTAVLGLTACTSPWAEGPSEEEQPAAEVRLATPAAGLTVVPEDDPVAAAIGASRALFDRAEVAVLAQDGDTAATLLGSSAAVGLGVPLLLVPAGRGEATAVGEELDRLGTTTVLAVGAAAETTVEGPEVVGVQADPEAVGAATGVEFGEPVEVASDGGPEEVAALEPERPAVLVEEDAAEASAAPSTSDGGGTLPPVDRADPLSGTVVVATGEGPTTAGIATARAAGARVQLTGGETDPRASADLVSAFADESPESVVALGGDLAAEEGLDWKLEAATSGTGLPGGGQLVLPGRMLVALYGSPGTSSLGVLGEQDLEASIRRAEDVARPYEDLVDVPVVPTFEIIVTVASSEPGPDGNYSTELDMEELRPWVDAAGEAGVYVVLDLQPGRTDFLEQAKRYRSLLEEPHVGLALDPEWRLRPGEVHLQQIGSVGIEEVNRVVTWLADLTREAALPQKLLVLHQFRLSMLRDREGLDTSRDELAVMVHADGQGGQGAKQETWRALRQDAPKGIFWGWKNFYDEDEPMLTPEQTVADVDPRPDLVSYQ